MKWFNITLFFIILIFYSFISTGKIFAEDRVSNNSTDKIIVYNEIGFYNVRYKSKLYKENAYDSFCTFVSNAGIEYSHKTDDGYIAGAGFTGTIINSGSKMNYDTLVVQPFTSIVLPYFFIGNDFKLWSLEIGISYFFTFEDLTSRTYLAADGSEIEIKNEDGVFNREESHVFLNTLLRIFPEDWIHLKIRVGRERFSAVDSLFNVGIVLPLNKHTFEFNFSFPTTIKYYMPTSNQRMGILYTYLFDPYIVGVYIGYLLYNHRDGGSGGISVFDYNNISGGIDFGVRW